MARADWHGRPRAAGVAGGADAEGANPQFLRRVVATMGDGEDRVFFRPAKELLLAVAKRLSAAATGILIVGPDWYGIWSGRPLLIVSMWSADSLKYHIPGNLQHWPGLGAREGGGDQHAFEIRKHDLHFPLA